MNVLLIKKGHGKPRGAKLAIIFPLPPFSGSNMKHKYIRTDLAEESDFAIKKSPSEKKASKNKPASNKNEKSNNNPSVSPSGKTFCTGLKTEGTDGYSYIEKKHKFAQCTILDIQNETGSEKLGKPVGRYVTIKFNKIWLLSDREKKQISKLISSELSELCERASKNFKSVIIAGLGNRGITADAIGPQTVDQIAVTRHIKEQDSKLFDSLKDELGCRNISAIVPGVIGQTGIETAELISGAVKYVKPQLVICIDALAARSVERLATTVQLSDTGISPGSGVKNSRMTINSELLGVPVIAIGVPTVVDSSTLVYDALEKAGITEFSPELVSVLESGRSFFVSLKETDTVTREITALVSEAVNLALGSSLSS